MALAAWWRGDALPNLSPIAGMTVRSADDETIAAINRLSHREIRRRRNTGSTPYVAEINGQPSAYGWAAALSASIGELGIEVELTPGSRYLWDFATLPEWQGRGIYPRLLQAIIRLEAAERYWILYAPENLPSGAGIAKAGFTTVGLLSFQRNGAVGLVSNSASGRARSGAALFGIPLLADDSLRRCWRCASDPACNCQHQPERCTCVVPLRSASVQNTPVFEFARE